MSIPADKLLDRIGSNRELNGAMASRLPPGQSAGMSPAEFFKVYSNGGLMDELREQLGPPIASPGPAFNLSAAIDKPSTSLNPKFLK
jgi:hypothetical protein